MIESFINSVNSRINTNSHTYESYRVDEVYSGIELGDGWKEYLKDKIIIPVDYKDIVPEFGDKALMVDMDLYKMIVHNFPEMRLGNFIGTGDDLHTEVQMTDTQMNILIEASSFCRKVGYDSQFKWKIVRFNNKEVIARFYEDTMLFSENTFTMNQDDINKVFFEEYLHGTTGASDYSRRFQNAIFDAWYIEAKKVVNQQESNIHNNHAIPNKTLA